MPLGRALVAVGAELQQQLLDVLKSWAVLAVGDGEAAIEHLWEASPDLIVLDLELPRHSAYDVLRHLSMRRPELLDRTVAVIDGGSPEMHALVHSVRVGSYLEKPVDAASLRAAVAKVAAI